MELKPWINIGSARSQAALTCIQYLTLDCFKIDLTDDEVHDFVHKGYYGFQDYAARYWYDHVELSLSDLEATGVVNSLLSALNLILTRNWNPSKATEQKTQNKSVPIKVVQQLKVLKDARFPEVYRRLTVLASARKRLGAPSLFEFLNFRIPVGRARALLEGQHEPVCSTTQVQDLQKFYGHAFNEFKCRQESCEDFSRGFACARERQKHEGRHDRSFRCSETTCPSADIGFATNTELKSHLISQHPQNVLFHETEVDCMVNCTFNDEYGDYDDTSIVEAAGQGLLDMVKSFVRDGVDINTRDAEGMTALHRASLGGHGGLVRFLVGADHIALSAQDTSGDTALMGAAYTGHEAIVRLLIERGGMDVDTQNTSGDTALIQAAWNGHEAIVRLLLERGDVDANAQNKHGDTALMLAAYAGHGATVRLLLERGDVNADAPNNRGDRALIQAAWKGHETIVRLLLERDDVDANAQNKHGDTALMLAAYAGHGATVRLLFERGYVDVNAQNSSGDTALIQAACTAHEAIVRLLLERGDVDANIPNNRGDTALIHAATKGHVVVVGLLLADRRVDVNITTRGGWTALMRATQDAASKQHIATARLLREHINMEIEARPQNTFG